MRITTTILAACLCVALVNAVPVPDDGFKSQALDRLMVVEADDEAALRNKRTIGLLRQLFPDVSKMIEDKVNSILGEVFKIFGPVVIQSVLGNRNGGGGGIFGGGGKSDSGTTVMVKSPFDDDEEDDGLKSFVDDDDFFSKPIENTADNGTKISFELPTIKSVDETKTTTTTEGSKIEETTVNAKVQETTVDNDDNVTSNTVQ